MKDTRDRIDRSENLAGQNYEHAWVPAAAGVRYSAQGDRPVAATRVGRGAYRVLGRLTRSRGLRKGADWEHMMRAVQWAVLIVEDDLAVLGMLGELFEAEGYRVQRAVNGSAGLACIARGGLDLVLLDVRLPDGSGLEVCRQVRSREQQRQPGGLGAHLPIVMLSAWEDPEWQQAALAAGANAYVTKPFDVDALLARVQACLNGC